MELPSRPRAYLIIKKKEGIFNMNRSDSLYSMQEKGTLTNGSEENELSYSKDEVRVPIHLKLTLTIKEAAEYSNIGINKIDTMLKQPNCPFVLFVGTRKLVKRREFEEYIRREVVI